MYDGVDMKRSDEFFTVMFRQITKYLIYQRYGGYPPNSIADFNVFFSVFNFANYQPIVIVYLVVKRCKLHFEWVCFYEAKPRTI